MDQNRPENNTNQQQNVHLHMHHMCNCQTQGMYPAYPAYPMGYRPPVPAMMGYSQAPRPVFHQPYQYPTYEPPYLAPVMSNTSLYGGCNNVTSGNGDTNLTKDTTKETKDVGELNGNSVGDVERNEPPVGYDCGLVTPPANELLMTENFGDISTENFVKFLERSCSTAEQIAYRNRNRPCFRNIQNLCIRTRSEILKPCTTISNIHSQGIPWATKDFIYAFVRLTNCWHILKGYWENRDGSSLGKIEKELTPEFRSCYVRWEKETIELASELTRVFYNLDTTLNAQVGVNLVPPQVAELLTNPVSAQAKYQKAADVKVRETVDQAQQTADFKYDCNFEEEARRIYMKPGSYKVPKKEGNDVACNVSPRGIEFLETAQNVNKARELSGNYWASFTTKKPMMEMKREDVEPSCETNSESAKKNQPPVRNITNVRDWLVHSNFSDCVIGTENLNLNLEAPSTPRVIENSSSFFSEPLTFADMNPLDKVVGNGKKLQMNGNGTFRIKREAPMKLASNIFRNGFELKFGGISEAGALVLDKMLMDLKDRDYGQLLLFNENKSYDSVMDLRMIIKKFKAKSYMYINEIVRDLKYLASYMSYFPEMFLKYAPDEINIIEMLNDYFPQYDFADVQWGECAEQVGALKLKKFSEDE